MSDEKAPKIEFPCDYAIKVIGNAAPDFRDFVLAVVERHAPRLDVNTVTVNDSRNGRFCSVRLTMVATGEPQLQALFNELKASGRVHMVL
ncbi:hypothetical protein ABA45_04240 [Marinobacter psychrophilus]|jgi:putative lipoic acid-binding regulatory protein|uniref:UPF0250 protein ABA45_04240 n=1 Tax=Marinobacter psychrophilus TaxID=330734 RepID=A0A0H4I1N8_9GAMM|nr:DUF493 domain-containing protein [Marinobacter psychrophilus]AKO51728.1 hypothetical protein ABA45_04240 [Marinobacter psychrophilus]